MLASSSLLLGFEGWTGRLDLELDSTRMQEQNTEHDGRLECHIGQVESSLMGGWYEGRPSLRAHASFEVCFAMERAEVGSDCIRVRSPTSPGAWSAGVVERWSRALEVTVAYGVLGRLLVTLLWCSTWRMAVMFV